MSERPLLMIPGPIEISPAVQAAADGPPPAHTSPALIRSFGDGLRAMLSVWKAGPGAFPYVVAGSGTLAMDMAVANLLDPGDAAVVIDTGYFSDRMARMLERRGVTVRRVGGVPGDAPSADEISACLAAGPVDAVFVTHVDTSTGVRTDVAAIAAQVRPTGALLVVDGVCATGGEALDMGVLGVDVYLTASQKAIGLPPGLALLVASARAEEARARRKVPVPMFLDWAEWKPILTAYLEGRPSYFATPATSLVRALPVALGEIGDVDAAVARHARAADAMRRAWAALGLSLVPARPEITANTLSALWLPDGVDATLPARIAAHGVLVAGGLHPAIRTRYFRVGHMGYSTTRPDHLERCVRAVARGLADAGAGVDEAAAVVALG